MRRIERYFPLLLLCAIVALVAACSTQKNTAGSRWWHSFNARYNTYFNGSQAYIDGSLEKETGNKDNFTELIPLYTVGNKDSRELGKSNFDRAIEKSEKAIHQHSIKRRPVWDKQRRKTDKDREWLSRREYNPFLWKAWLLMGRAQFHEGAFDEAVSTFSYMSRLYSTQPAIYGRARAWLAKSYIENDWIYDAEDVIRNMRRDSIHWRAQKEWDYTLADYYLHTEDYQKAVNYLHRVVKHEMRRKQKAREWFLMGQLYERLGKADSAYRAFRHVVRMNPPYQLEFNARIAQTEVMAKGQSKKMIRKLRRMAASDNNKDYLEQVFYAIGNIYLADKDTLHAISAYEEGNKKATRSGIEKGVLLLRLGDLYFAKEKFSDAKRCYGEAIGLLDTDRKDYAQLSERSKVLDELVPYTDAVQLQDSLQALAKMSEKDRNAAIDRVIDALKKKEREEARAQAEQNAAQAQAQNAASNAPINQNRPAASNQQQSSTWYFYNPTAVSQGKATFERLWGKRENVDNWQRINRTVVASGIGEDSQLTDEQRDSIAREVARQDSIEALKDSAQNDPHRREYYLAQIPFTPEQLEASNKILEDGLHHSGVIFKDKMNNLRLAERNLRRVADNYPDYEQMDDVYYHLFLLYSRLGMTSVAEGYVDKLKQQYPESQWATLLSDPYYAENARFGQHMEDSLYASTYTAFKENRLSEVRSNVRLSASRFPMGANRDKFLFIGGLSKLNDGDADGCLNDMQEVVSKYPESSVSEMAGMIVNGVKAGRRLRGGRFDIGDVWSRRSAVLADSDSIAARQFSNERNTDFLFMIVYRPDSVNENQLLYELARFNFTNFLVRDFSIVIDEDGSLHRMQVSGFRNYDEALQYARQLHSQTGIMRLITNGRPIIISTQNLELIGRPFSYNDYDEFYAKHFAPLKISTFQLLTEPAEVTTRPQKEPTIEDVDRQLDNGTFIQMQPELEPSATGTTIIPEEQPTSQQPQGGIVIPAEEQKNTEQQGTTVLPAEQPSAKEPINNGQQQGTTVLPAERPAASEPSGTTVMIDEQQPKAEAETSTTVAPDKQNESSKPVTSAKPTTPTQPISPKAPTTTAPKAAKQPVNQRATSTGIYFNDTYPALKTDTTKTKKNASASKKKPQKQKTKTFDLEDEYYDLEGF